MSSKILKKPVIFHVMGVPGSGKSFFSKNLSKQLNAVHIDSQRIRYELFEEQSYSEDEEVVVENMVDYFAHTVIYSNLNVIIDGTSDNSRRRKEVAKLAEKNKYEYILVWLQANDELCKVRAMAPVDSGDNGFKRRLTGAKFTELSGKLNKPTGKEDPIVVSGSHSFRAQLKSVVTRLNSLNLLSIGGGSTKPKPAQSQKQPETAAPAEPARPRRDTQRISG